MKIGVIIPSHGLADKLEKCLKHLEEQDKSHNLYSVIIDNGTRDESVYEAFQRIYRDKDICLSTYVKLPWNSTFARASNMGIHVVEQADAFLFLNNDCYVDKDCVEHMMNALKRGKGDIIGARLRFPDGTIQHAGGQLHPQWAGVIHIHAGLDNEDPLVLESKQMPCVTGACMLVRATPFVELGGFQEIYHNGYEDVDLCLRFKENGGKIWYCAEATAIHEQAQTPGRMDHEYDNAKTFVSRWHGKDISKFIPVN